MYLAGIDIGTTGCKCSVYTDSGEFITEAYREYSINVSEDMHSVDFNIIWDNIKLVMKEITNVVNQIEAICVTSFGEASVIVGDDGEALLEALLFTDPNGQAECDEIEENLGAQYIYEHMGIAPGKMYSASKWMWQKKYCEREWQKAKYVFLMEDYIVYKLSGVRQIDYSLATRTMAFDIKKLAWDEKVLDMVGITTEMLSTPVATGSVAGEMLADISREFGFINEPIIVSGCHDQIAAAIGSGIMKAGQAVDGTGTVECVTCAFSKSRKVKSDDLYDGGYAVVPYNKDLFVTYAFTYTGGALLKWYRDKIMDVEAKVLSENGQNIYQSFNEKIKMEKPSGILITPHFAGAGTPYMNNDAKGVIQGVTLETDKYDIYQGLMEGTAYEMRLSLEILEAAGVEVDVVVATGGGASSKEWLQIKADIYGKKVVSLGAAQSGTLACIMLAGVACKRFADLEEASNIYVIENDVYFPRDEVQEKYTKLYEEYKMLYPKLY